MTLITRRRAAVTGLLASAALSGVFALNSPLASAADSSAMPMSSSPASGPTGTQPGGGVAFGGGAVDLDGNPVETRSYVGNTPPDDLGTLGCSGTVSVDGTVTDQQGDCDLVQGQG